MRYEKPATAKEAAGLLAKEKGAAFLLGGGTDLLVKLKMGMVEPDLVVDVKHIAKANEIQTTFSQVAWPVWEGRQWQRQGR